MRKLVEMGYFGLEHGGMIQHDEALSDYKGIILTFDSSLQFIKENFPGKLPKVAFSIDSFGHSSLSPYLFKALGHEALVVYRMPNEMFKHFNDNHDYLFTWEGDNSERIRVYRLLQYALNDNFNLDREAKFYGTCFKGEDENCAVKFLENHVNIQLFNAEKTY